MLVGYALCDTEVEGLVLQTARFEQERRVLSESYTERDRGIFTLWNYSDLK
jgi:hypothetical protein